MTNRLPKILRARELRKEATAAEKVLWKFLKNRKFWGRKFRRQYICQGFILDFYCPEEKIAIELDGGVHLKQKEYDSKRQHIIEETGIRFLRFKNEEVFDNIQEVLRSIKENLVIPD